MRTPKKYQYRILRKDMTPAYFQSLAGMYANGMAWAKRTDAPVVLEEWTDHDLCPELNAGWQAVDVIDPTETDDTPSRYLRHHGWIQGAMRNGRGQACALGALQMSECFSGFKEWRQRFTEIAKEKFPERMNEKLISNRDGVVWFNDHQDTTMRDVVMIMEAIEAESNL
jgi:hypothetical protein